MQQFPDDILKSLRKHLEDEKARLATRIEELSVQDPFRDPNRTNDNAASDTEASEESDHDRVAALVEEQNAQMGALDRALARIDDGSYGFCTVCGEMIDTDRLAIVPTATLCMKHETEQAKKKKVTA